MITNETFFWFYSTMAQVAAAIMSLIGVFIITYYLPIRTKQLDKMREEKDKIDELSEIKDLRIKFSFLFKDNQGLFLNEPTNSKMQRNYCRWQIPKRRLSRHLKKSIAIVAQCLLNILRF